MTETALNAASALARIRAAASTPGLSAADVYQEVAAVLEQFGTPVYDYEDPDNPYREDYAMTGDDRDWQQKLDDMAAAFPVGARVRLNHEIWRYPHFIAEKGLTGVVIEATEELFSVRMDEPLEGAEDWDNELHWYPHNCDEFPQDDELVVIDQHQSLWKRLLALLGFSGS